MTVLEFWDGIGLGKAHREAAYAISNEEQECQRLLCLYKKDHEQFFSQVLQKQDHSLWFLWLYSSLACEVYERYLLLGIAEDIFWDTFLDIRFWCENAERESGTLGLLVYEWFYRHIDMVLFRLGRLQFELGEEEINIHIPQGEPLLWQECERSILRAKQLFGTTKPYVCHSWLLYPALGEMLEETSNIREFQRHFHICRIDFQEREAEWRVFGKVRKNIAEYPEETSLQRSVKAYLLEGNSLGNGWGILKERL